MKLYGYTERPGAFNAESPDTLSEATLVASPAELRRIAEFLISAANTMEEVGDRYDHQHLSDHDRSFRTSPQFVVCRQR